MEVKILVEDEKCVWLMTSSNGRQWNGLMLRDPIADATAIRDVLDDFINGRETGK